MKIFKYSKAIIYSILLILILGFLIFLSTRNTLQINDIRNIDSYSVAECISFKEVERPDAPLGKATEYIVKLPEIKHDTSLIFYNSHSIVEVYIGNELIYSVKPLESTTNIKTTGGVWNDIHLCHTDVGKNCKVVIAPIYENYESDFPIFMIGSLYSVMMEEARSVLPELIVTIIVLLVGIVALIAGIIFWLKTKIGMNFIAMGSLAVAISLWRFNYFSLIELLAGEKTVFVYYFSLMMLMLSMIPLLECVKDSFSKFVNIICNVLSTSIAFVGIVQIVLQILGIADLRETLTIVHLGIILTLALILVCLVIQFVRHGGDKNTFNPIIFIVFGVGFDLLFYYIEDAYSGLIFSLLAISIFVLYEGGHFVIEYVEHKEQLAEVQIKLAHNETKLAESRFIAMISQIRSHFIFNILNAISGMCKYDPERADKTIVHFARFLRSNIDLMQNDDLTHFHNALHHLEDYIALEQVRYGDNIQFITDIQYDDFSLPSFVIQPLVENSIKHGLAPKPDGGTITLRTRKDNENVYIIVEDDGIGYNSDGKISDQSIGLKNIRFRLDHMVNGTLKVESIVDIGTKATITIPCKEAEKCV